MIKSNERKMLMPKMEKPGFSVPGKTRFLFSGIRLCILFLGVLFACGTPPLRSDKPMEPSKGISGKPHILLINSNAGVEKYRVVQDEFRKSIPNPIREVDLRGKANDGGMNGLSSENANLIYCVGGRAYHLAKQFFAEKEIIFSSIINWLRLPNISPKTYGVSTELHPRMPVFMFRSVFPDIKRIGMLYSLQYTSQWFENTRRQALELGIGIVGKAVPDENQTLLLLEQLLPEVDAIWLISDPLVMAKKNYLYDILDRCDADKTPVFSYHEAYAKLGAVMIVSPDTPTIGRQVANIAMGLLSEEPIEEKVQFPAGSHIVLNLKQVEKYGLKYNKNALGMINTIIK